MSKHTPTPWRVGRKSQRSILSSDGTVHIAQALPNQEADAARIVECVNAFEGVPNPIQWMREAAQLLDELKLQVTAVQNLRINILLSQIKPQ